MPSAIQHLESEQLARRVADLGRLIRQRRKVLEVSATTAAGAAGMSRVTWHRIEKGETSVTIAAWFNALAVIGLEFGIGLVDPAKGVPNESAREPCPDAGCLPVRIALRDYPQLQALAWQVPEAATISAREAHDIYERNRRHIDWDAMQAHERRLIDALQQVFVEGGRV